ncbi:MAG TPA: hypothetical protein PLE74_02660 [Candidatus Cloacimonadota bacterium]|nr:hypothetical protein [Candidatus Cloacimonadota bacterium]HPT71165.1 hypothetical protein [Candidatus Cloacimonadota bacterium]
MPRFEREETPKRYPISATIKFVILILIIFGFWLRSCYYKQLPHNMVISDVYMTSITPQSVDVNFTLENRKAIAMDQNLFIQVYTTENYMIASKIVKVTVPASTKLEYIKTLDNMNRQLHPRETLQKATVELYYPKLF